MAECHPEKPHWARGFCGTCYQKWWNEQNPGKTRARIRARENPAECHPDKQALARGLCQTCYRRWWRLQNPGAEWERQNAANSATYGSLTPSERRDRSLKRYGMTEADYEAMLTAQANLCAVCRQPSTRRLEVDHCHATGVVRALLCHNCNSALGHAKDNVTRLQALIGYLQIHQAPQVSEAECSQGPSGPVVKSHC